MGLYPTFQFRETIRRGPSMAATLLHVAFLPTSQRVHTAHHLPPPPLRTTQTHPHRAWSLLVNHPTVNMDMSAGVALRLFFRYPALQSPKQSFQSFPWWPCRWLSVQFVATGLCTPFRRGVKSLPFVVDDIEYS